MHTRIHTALLSALTLTVMTAMAEPGPGYGYGPGMMWQQQMTPEQWQQRWEQMHRQGYGPGMMQQYMTPDQYQQWWGHMNRQWQGYGPGMMGPGMMGPGMMGPGMMGYGPGPGPGPGMMQQYMTPDQYKQWWEHMRQQFNPAPAK